MNKKKFFLIIIMISNKEIIKNIINFILNNNYLKSKFKHHKQKYSINELLEPLFNILLTGISYREVGKLFNINWTTIYKFHQKIIKLNIFPLYYNFLLNAYLKKNSNNLNYLIVDSTFIVNKKGSELITYNPQIKKHKTCKISLIVDEFNIPINFKLENSLKHDSKLFQEQLKYITENMNLKNKIYLGDAAYDSN